MCYNVDSRGVIMGRMELNHWFVDEDGLSIALMRYYVEIKILNNKDYTFYRLGVHINNSEELVFNFYALDDAVYFTESVISKSEDKDQIVEVYQQMFEEKRFQEPKKKTIRR